MNVFILGLWKELFLIMENVNTGLRKERIMTTEGINSEFLKY